MLRLLQDVQLSACRDSIRFAYAARQAVPHFAAATAGSAPANTLHQNECITPTSAPCESPLTAAPPPATLLKLPTMKLAPPLLFRFE
jgi:hypothetical protein